MSDVTVARTRVELAAARHALSGTIAFVPTMGALHEGHRSLLRRAKTLADHVVVSIFVNPLQFGPNEDFDRYPRTLDADLVMCADEGVALVFAPSREEIYPQEPIVRVCAGAIGERFEGASRPGHFDGVLTVVAKLFGLVRPDIAVFGQKDAQQLTLIKRMVADLELGVRIDAAPIVRDADGLALSSRNRYLSADERQTALSIPSALDAGLQVAENGGAPDEIVAATQGIFDTAEGIDVDYVALVDPDSFDDVSVIDHECEAILAVAARVGNTRLIDNVVVSIQKG